MENIFYSEITNLIGTPARFISITKNPRPINEQNPNQPIWIINEEGGRTFYPTGNLLLFSQSLLSLVPNVDFYRLQRNPFKNTYSITSIALSDGFNLATNSFVNQFGTREITNEFYLRLLGINILPILRLFISPNSEPKNRRRIL